MQEKQSAILLFSQSAEADFAQKAFGLSFQRFSKVHKALVNKVINTAQASGLPVFEATSEIQRGTDFGSRLFHAIHWVSEQGFDQIIIIGNDSPGLTAAQIQEAAKCLNGGQSVLGKDQHGGAYLIGLNIDKTDLEAFKNIQWQTSKVFSQLTSLLPEVQVLVKIHTDLNGLGDLKSIVKGTEVINSFIAFLLLLVFGAVAYFRTACLFLKHTTANIQSHRGPPVLACFPHFFAARRCFLFTSNNIDHVKNIL